MSALAIVSPSAAVARVLHALAAQAGYDVDATADQQLQHEGSILTWVQHGAAVHRWQLPVRPQAIVHVLQHMVQPSSWPLAQGWSFDATARQLQHGATQHSLTEKESALLAALLQSYPDACPRDALLKNIWGMQTNVETHTLETHIYRLRHKLAELTPKPCDIVTTDSAYALTLEPTT